MAVRRWQLGWPVTIGYAIVALAVVASGWAAARLVGAARTASNRARVTADVLRQIGEIELTVLDAETGQRGFLLTGEEAYLEPYTRAAHSIDRALDDLAQLIGTSPDQEERMQLVRDLVAQKMAELNQTIELRRTAGPAAALGVVDTHVGKGIMDRLLRILGEIEREEQAVLGRQLDERRSTFWWASRVALASSAAALIAIALSTLAANSDVRRRAAIQRSLRESEERLHVTLRSIGDAVIATDRTGRVVFMNAPAQQLTGWSEPEASGLPLAEIFRIFNERTQAPVESPVDVVLRQGVVVGLANHTVLRSRSGKETPIDDSGAPIRDAEGVIMGVVLVFRDVSEAREQARARESLEQETAARLNAERDSRTKDEFLAILSHELRSPLQGILGWLTVLREMRPDAEQQQRALQAIERGVRQQAQLVNDILDVSRIVAGKLQLVRERIELIAVVEECVDQMTPQAREKGLEIATDNVDCGVVLGDRHRLRQLLTNLLTNAIKFTPAGGRIDVRCYRDGGEIVVALRDTGQGIEPEFLPHIFDRFMQAGNVARPSTAGLGLGLSIVRQIADLHGGSVRAESDGVGKGSMFTLRMPLAPVQHEDGDEPATRMLPSVRSTLDGLSILVVDDDCETRESLALLLESRGATVRHVGSAAAALDACAAHPPDVILSDISMPELDGYALIDALRRQSDGHQPVAVALTGFAADVDRNRATEAGFDAHVPKPVDLDHLVSTILDLVAWR